MSNAFMDRLERAKTGDLMAFQALVVPHLSRVDRIILRRAGPHALDDIRQETFRRAAEKVVNFTPRLTRPHEGDDRDALYARLFGSWLCQFAQNIAFEFNRDAQNGSRASSILNVAADPNGRTPSSQVAEKELLQEIVAAISTRFRSICLNNWVRGKTVSVIAGETGKPEGAIRGILYRMKCRLKRRFQSPQSATSDS